MKPEDAISLALYALYQERADDLGFREDVIEKIKSLRSNHVPVSGIRIRPGIDGDYSDEVSDFVGRLAIAGYIVQESPIKLTSRGVSLLREHLRGRMNDPDVKRGARALSLNQDALGDNLVIADRLP